MFSPSGSLCFPYKEAGLNSGVGGLVSEEIKSLAQKEKVHIAFFIEKKIIPKEKKSLDRKSML